MRKLPIAAGLVACLVALLFVFTKEDQFGDLVFHVPFVFKIAFGIVLGFCMIVALVAGVIFRREIAGAIHDQFTTREAPQPTPPSPVATTGRQQEPRSGGRTSLGSTIVSAFWLATAAIVLAAMYWAVGEAEKARLQSAYALDRQALAARLAEEEAREVRPTQAPGSATTSPQHPLTSATPAVEGQSGPSIPTNVFGTITVTAIEQMAASDDDNGPVFKRSDFEKRIGKKSCNDIKREIEELRDHRIGSGLPISFFLREELEALEAFACNPKFRTYSSSGGGK